MCQADRRCSGLSRGRVNQHHDSRACPYAHVPKDEYTKQKTNDPQLSRLPRFALQICDSYLSHVYIARDAPYFLAAPYIYICMYMVCFRLCRA